MLIVRFPNGVSIQYNTAHYLIREAASWQIYTDDPAAGGKWVASVAPQSGCLIEAVPACRIENPVEQLTNDRALAFVIKNIFSYGGQYRDQLRELKRKLAAYNSQTGTWKS